MYSLLTLMPHKVVSFLHCCLQMIVSLATILFLSLRFLMTLPLTVLYGTVMKVRIRRKLKRWLTAWCDVNNLELNASKTKEKDH